MSSNSERTKAWKAQARTRPIPEELHGAASTYSNWGCRCDPCRQANTDYCYAKTQKRRRASD